MSLRDVAKQLRELSAMTDDPKIKQKVLEIIGNPPEPGQSSAPARTGAAEAWMVATVPFGKQKDKKFGDLTKGQLWWWCTQWEPKQWTDQQGQTREPSQANLDLKIMLNQVPEHHYKKDQ